MASEEVKFDSDVLKTFQQFLSKSAPPNVRGIAMEYLLGCTGTKEGVMFVATNPECMTSIIELLDDTEVNVSMNAYKALVNLTAEPGVAALIANLQNFQEFIRNQIKLCLLEGSMHTYNASKVISNLSRWEECSAVIKMCLKDNNSDIDMYRVVDAFAKAPERLEYFARFLSNMSCHEEIRKLLMDKNRCIIQRLLPLLSSNSIIVRQGVVGTIRNCAFETEYHEWLLSSAVDLLPRLLLPLAGPEEFDDEDTEKLPDDLQYLGDDKTRESDPDIQQMLVETINKLCATKHCRQYIKDKNSYVILRELHKWEKSPSVLAAVENLVSVLISDEPEPGMENLDTVEIPEQIESKLRISTDNTSKEI